MLLTKDLLPLAQNCTTLLWRETRRRLSGERAPLTASDQFRIAMGRRVGDFARQMFPGGIDCMIAASNEEEAIFTREKLEDGDTFFEPTFVGDRAVARCDVLRRDEFGWHLIEVKSAKLKDETKPDYIWDIAFQVDVLAENGIDVHRCSLMLLNPGFVWDGGEIRPEELFLLQDVTKLVAELRPKVAEMRTLALDVMADADMPTPEIKKACAKCEFRTQCHPDLGVDHVVFLPKVRQKRMAELMSDGWLRIGDLPEDRVQPSERPAWNCFSQDRGYVAEDLADQLSRIKMPAAFLDFEYGGTAIPVVPGYGCHEAVSFQWSAHVLHDPRGVPEHFEFLSTEDGDPAEAFTQGLLELVTQVESIVVYSSAERTRVEALRKRGVAGAEMLLAHFDSKHFDLERCIAKCVYFPGFMGQSSIKVVLPALVPELTYKNLAISDGGLALVEYFRMRDSATPEAEKEQIAKNLREYCALDTFGMVELYRRLRELRPAVAF